MRRFVISDVHGCFKTLKELISQLELQESDKLYFLGDYINKGPDSKAVLDYIQKLTQSYEVVCLRGNHEQLLLDAFLSENAEKMFLERGGYQTLKSFRVNNIRSLPDSCLSWLNKLPLYFEMEDFILVHAGFNFDAPDFYKDEQAMLNIRSFKVDSSKVKGKLILHGHAPVNINELKSSLNVNHGGHIGLDNGCVYPHRFGMGNLVALNIDSWYLHLQPNVDFS